MAAPAGAPEFRGAGGGGDGTTASRSRSRKPLKTLGSRWIQVPESVRDEIPRNSPPGHGTGVDEPVQFRLTWTSSNPRPPRLYRPAYVDVRVFNKHDRMSAPGTRPSRSWPVQHPGYQFL
jgi:hypothetical protein